MKLNSIFAILLIGCLFYGWPVISALYNNYRMSEETRATVSWSLAEINDEEYRPLASYTYIVNDQSYAGKEILQNVKFRNPFSGRDALQKMDTQGLKLWYNPSNPSLSSLEKFFPIKRAIYTVMLLTLWGYFYYLITRYSSLSKV